MSRIKGGRHEVFTKLQRRQKLYDDLKAEDKQGRKRPGSTNDHKQT